MTPPFESTSILKPNKDLCKQPAGVFEPVVALGRCEGKADCARVCPEDVFDILPIAAADHARLSLLQKLKLRVHGGKVAYAVRADACRACGFCIAACPENAITLKRCDR